MPFRRAGSAAPSEAIRSRVPLRWRCSTRSLRTNSAAARRRLASICAPLWKASASAWTPWEKCAESARCSRSSSSRTVRRRSRPQTWRRGRPRLRGTEASRFSKKPLSTQAHERTDVTEQTEARATADVRLESVRKTFGEVVAVDGVDLEIEPGEFFSLLGPSGSGKTTMLRIIAGFERPDSGRVFLGGKDVTNQAPFERDVNTVFQDYALFPHMTIGENVEYGLKV